MRSRNEILQFLDSELHRDNFEDSSLNGLQVEGSETISVVCTAVDSGLSIIESACTARAELLVVHHGLFWGEPIPVTGSFKSLLQIATDNGLNIFASHLPLDAHERWGNNFGLARFLGLESLRSGIRWGGKPIGCIAANQGRISLAGFKSRLETLPGVRDILVLAFGPAVPQTLGIVTGSGSDALYRFRDEGFDTLITGEPRQAIYHFAKENKLNVICAGHYATETIGVRLLGEELKNRFGIEHRFIDEPTGI